MMCRRHGQQVLDETKIGGVVGNDESSLQQQNEIDQLIKKRQNELNT